MATSFAASWLSGAPNAHAFLPDRYRHPDARAAAAAAAAQRAPDPALVAALVRQNAALPPSPARDRHLDDLARPGTIAVATGQQVGLFLGPLFTVYKAAAAIAAARALSRETGRPCVPVFWLQTEDHDRPEIDHVLVPRATGAPLRLALPPDDLDPRVPVAHRRLGPGVQAALDTLDAELGHEPHARALLDLLSAAYTPDATFHDAFARTLAAVFADDGLVFLNPRDPAIARLAAPLHRRALLEAGPLSQALAQRARALTDAGFAAQVHIRPGAPLAFFSPDAVDGPRYRLDPTATPDRWALVGHPADATVTTATLLDALDADPLRLTTSALLRPLLQDTLLPTAGYVGGPGEMAYFAQLGPLYDALDLPMPLTIPRARFRVVDDRARGLLAKLDLTPADLAQPREALLTRLAARAADDGFDPPDAVHDRLLAALAPELARLGALMTALDPNLAKAVSRTEDGVRDALSKLVAKYGRALGQRDHVALERLDRARAFLHPDDAPQERVLGLPYFAARLGTKTFARLVVDACVPFSGELRDLTP